MADIAVSANEWRYFADYAALRNQTIARRLSVGAGLGQPVTGQSIDPDAGFDPHSLAWIAPIVGRISQLLHGAGRYPCPLRRQEAFMGIERLNPSGLHTPRGYSHVAIIPGGMHIHLSGQVSLDPAGELVGVGDLGAQAEQVFANLKTALHGAGATMAHIAKLVTYVVDLTPERAAAVRTVRMRYFGDGPYPASTMVGVTSLVHPDFLIEIEAVAVAP